MNLNATLLAQGINFLIAYGLIRFLFIKPVLRELNQEKREIDGLEHALTANKEAFEKEREVGNIIAREQHAHFSRHTPSAYQDAAEYYRVPTVEAPMPDHSQNSKCVQGLRESILKYVQGER